MDWTSVVIALGGLSATVATSALTLRHQRRSDEARYRRESYRAAYLEFLCTLEEAQYRVSPLGEVSMDTESRDLLRRLEIARVAIDMYAPLRLRKAAYEASLALHELARPDLSDENLDKNRVRLHDSRAALVDAVRAQLSPDEERERGVLPHSTS